MMLELEKQRLTRRISELQTAMSEIMWKGATTLNSSTESKKNDLFILPPNAESKLESESIYTTSYEKMVDEHIIDLMEIPKGPPALPVFLRDSLGSSSRSVTRTGLISPIRDTLSLDGRRSIHSRTVKSLRCGVHPGDRSVKTIKSSPFSRKSAPATLDDPSIWTEKLPGMISSMYKCRFHFS